MPPRERRRTTWPSAEAATQSPRPREPQHLLHPPPPLRQRLCALAATNGAPALIRTRALRRITLRSAAAGAQQLRHRPLPPRHRRLPLRLPHHHPLRHPRRLRRHRPPRQPRLLHRVLPRAPLPPHVPLHPSLLQPLWRQPAPFNIKTKRKLRPAALLTSLCGSISTRTFTTSAALPTTEGTSSTKEARTCVRRMRCASHSVPRRMKKGRDPTTRSHSCHKQPS